MSSHISRRTLLRLLAGAAGISACDAQLALPEIGLIPKLSPHQDSLFNLQHSSAFGINATGEPLSKLSLYNVATPRSSGLSFDVSNHFITAMFSRHGQLQHSCISRGVVPLPVEKIMGGVYCGKQLLYGQPMLWDFRVGAKSVASISPAVSLIESILPVFTWQLQDITVHMLACSPIAVDSVATAPRAVITLFLIENRGSISQNAQFTLSANTAGLLPDKDCSRGVAAVRQLDTPVGQRSLQDSPLLTEIAAHSDASFALAWILEEDSAALEGTARRLQAAPAEIWVSETLARRLRAYGQLSIPESPYYGEGMVRFAELCHQSVLHNREGAFTGGFVGSDFDEKHENWNKDTYYSMLASSLFHPQLCARSIPYFLRWGHPPECAGRGLKRFPGVGPITQSLSNSLSGLAIAGALYRSTGDGALLRQCPDLLQQAERLFDMVLASRRGEPFLFPSMYFSDGDARGDYHTGSNLAAWFAFSSMARIARDVYRANELATDWDSIASRIKRDLLRYCCGKGPLGDQFFEGANADGSFVLGHDGEESDTTLMPFYGFCAADDPRLQRHARLALSDFNPLYAKAVDGIWWYNDKWKSATFPGWTTALAGASYEKELEDRLERIRGLTDLDGSIWWWPFPYRSSDPSKPERANEALKSGWAAAVYLCRFVHDILGVQVDVPSRTVAFAPFSPWKNFRWSRFGNSAAVFDFSRTCNEHSITMSVRNRNSAAYTTSISLLPPINYRVAEVRFGGAEHLSTTDEVLWERPAKQLCFSLSPGAQVFVTGALVPA